MCGVAYENEFGFVPSGDGGSKKEWPLFDFLCFSGDG